MWFALASLVPAVLLGAACLFGSPLPIAAILAITVFVFFVDRLVRRLMPETQPGASGLWVSVLQAGAHWVLWPLGLWAIGTASHLETVEKVLVVVGLGLYFGQVSNSNAHELIHSRLRWQRWLGTAIYVSLLHGHHVSAHLRVHHVHAATRHDPNSARPGEGFWAYLWRAWRGEWRAGRAAEDALRRRRAAPTRDWGHPYTVYGLGSVSAVLVSIALGGIIGPGILLIIAGYAQVQLFLSDYVQHYGLSRRVGPDGRPEPMGSEHSWNAPHWYSSAMMLNAPRHSDHHTAPSRPFPELRLEPDRMPILPHSLPVMAVIALVPPLWRRIMDPRLAAWHSNEPLHSTRDLAGSPA